MLKQAVFLVGGRGTRLGPLTKAVPKPMLDVGGRPFLDYLVLNAARHGLTNIILSCGYLSEQVVARYSGGDWGGAHVTCIVEPGPAGTGGALRHAAELLDDEFLVLNGDTLFDINLLDLGTIPDKGDWSARLALRQIPDASRYGVVELNDGRITEFKERGTAAGGLVSGGIYHLNRSILAELDREPLSIEADVFPRLAARGRVLGRAYDGFFLDIGIREELVRGQTLVPARDRRPAVFFDRDGVLNHDTGYVHLAEEFHWMDGAREAIKAVNDRGWYAFVVTNQAGVAHGLYPESAVVELHARMQAELGRIGAHVDRFEYCLYHPQGKIAQYCAASPRRKPAPGMLLDLMQRFPVDAEKSLLIGDRSKDIEAAAAAGVKGYLFSGGDLNAFLHDLPEFSVRGEASARP